MAPNRLPWSVSASAGNRSSRALVTSLSSCAAPSSRLYSEWTCRWTKSACRSIRSPRRGRAPPAPRCGRPPAPAGPSALGPARRAESPAGGRRGQPPRLLPLDRAGWLRRDVEDHPVDAGHLVDDAVTDLPEQIVRQAGPVRGHRVLGHDRPEGDHLGVRAKVAHDAHRAHRQEHGEGLPELALEPRRAHLLLHDRVGLTEEVQPLLGHVAQHPDREPGPRERLAPDDLGRESEELAELPDLVLEELPERLDEPELHAGGQAPDVVVRLD